MRVCILTTSFPSWKGHYRGTFILERAKALQAQGVQVRVIATHNPGTKTKEIIDGIEVIRPRYLWPERFEILQQVSAGLPVMWRRNYFTRFALIPYLARMGMEIARHARNFDLIHTHWSLSAFIAQSTRIFHRRPILVTVHGSDIYQAASLPAFRGLTKRVLDRCECVISVSQSLAKEMIELGVCEGKIRIVPNGVDTSIFHPSDRPREDVILFAGTLIERKGVRYLIDAMGDLVGQFPQYKLILLGEGPQQAALECQAQSLGLEEKVVFLGALTPPEVSDWMQRARLMVLPSLEEGFGVVLLEALACGTPCIATEVGGIPDIISSDIGLLVPPKDHLALRNAITLLLQDKPMLSRMSATAPRFVSEKYSWDSVAVKLIEIYKEVLSI